MSQRLDRDLLRELEILMEDGFTSLLDAYLRDSETRIFEAYEAWEAGDLDRLRRSAHSLKGSSSNIGAQALADYCSVLEVNARDGVVDEVPGALLRVRAELGEVRDAVMALGLDR